MADQQETRRGTLAIILLIIILVSILGTWTLLSATGTLDKEKRGSGEPVGAAVIVEILPSEPGQEDGFVDGDK